jgi:hypothetical protein
MVAAIREAPMKLPVDLAAAIILLAWVLFVGFLERM